MSALSRGGLCSCTHCRGERLIDNLVDIMDGDMDEVLTVVTHALFLIATTAKMDRADMLAYIDGMKDKFDARVADWAAGKMVH